jgi:hypothetical protein
LNVDCEGSELLVLRGARSLLEEHAPQIFCEIHHGYLGKLNQRPDEIVAFLTQLDYEVRPLRVEDFNGERNVEECSHLHARKEPSKDRIEELKRRIADLKERMPAHSVRPAMIQELEELEEQLKTCRRTANGSR